MISSTTVQPSDQMSDAGVAPFSSMTSGATMHGKQENQIVRTAHHTTRIEDRDAGRTPVRCASNVDLLLDSVQVQGDAKIGEFDIAGFGGENVCRLQVTVHDLSRRVISTSIQTLWQKGEDGCLD